MVAHANRVRFSTATTGTGTMAIGAAVSGFQTPATAGLPSGATVGYCIEENANFEVGQGVLTSGTPWTLSRAVIEASSNSGAAISLLGTATVFLTLTAAELDQMAALTYPRYSILHRLAMPQTGLLIPAYIYPNNPYSNATYRAFIALIRQYRDVPVIVVIDPAGEAGVDVGWHQSDDPDHISTSYAERQNLSMRMGMRRFTRLTNAISKKGANHAHGVAIYFMHYNLVRIHSTLRCPPAMAAGVTTKLWELADMVRVLEEWEANDSAAQRT